MYGPGGRLLWRDVVPVALGRTVRVETDDAGNAYVTGQMFLGTTVDAVTIKYAPNGTKLWTPIVQRWPQLPMFPARSP
jgi:hypothetical protein